MSDWFCPVCRFKIFGSKVVCAKCGTTKAQAQTMNTKVETQVEKNYKQGISNVSEQVFDLKDKLTDLEYKTLLDTLQTCYKNAPPDEKQNVIAPVPSVRELCSPAVRQGDWKCPGCNFFLFASRTECKKCNIKRP